MTLPLLILQRLCIEWGQAGTTALLTARRRGLPKSYPLLLTPVPKGVLAVAQNIEWTDEDGFTNPLETIHQYGQLGDLQPAEVEFTPGLDAESWQLAPLPLTGLSGSLKLGVGQLARFEWNERLGERRRHTIINVTLCRRPLRNDVFMRLPDLYQSHMIELREKARRAG